MASINYDIFPDMIKLNFNSDVLGVMVRQRKRMIVQIRKQALLEITNYFLDELKYRFIIASGMATDRGFDVIYHFSDDNTGYIINLMVSLNRKDPEIESLSNMISATNWIEREIHELFGIKFTNHPDLKSLISEGNWAKTDYPYSRPARDNKKSQRNE